MNLKEYLACDSKEELTDRLIKLDASIMALHQNGFYVVSFDVNNIKLYNGELTLASFNNKIDYLNSGINQNGDKKDILEMCAVGICAYNNFSSFYINKEFLAYLMENLDVFRENGQIPKEMYDYYTDVLINGNVDYLNNFLLKSNKNDELNGKGNGNSNSSSYSYHLTKSTAIGRAFAEKENAYVNVLILPAIIVLIYCTILVVLMIVR